MADTPFGSGPPTVLMIRPAAFGYNEDTAATNQFQTRPEDTTAETLQEKALAEFDALVEAIHNSGVEVIVIEDPPEPASPDALFPNNWISFHADGTVVLYPMCAPSRRLERRVDLIPILQDRHGFRASRVVDLSHHEEEGRFLEGTGSIVFDHPNHCAYANLSARTHPELVAELAELLGYEAVVFHAADGEGNEVYHTNVVMSIGTDFAVVAAEAISDSRERAALMARLEESGRRLIRIDLDQMGRFAGNVLEVKNRDGRSVLVMSTSARAAFEPDQLSILGISAAIVDSPLPTIETVGGGSARCMLAEVFLPHRTSQNH
jgi:hypothetical protein